MRIWKIARTLRGEWWIIDGQSLFADGDSSDMNHEGYVIQSIQSKYVDDEFNRGDYIDWQGFENTFQNPDRALKGLGMTDEEISIARGSHPDAREYGIKKLGWKRVAGNNVETQNLTSKDISDLRSGLGEILEQEAEDEEDVEFNIEVRSTNTLFSDVPYSVIEQRNPELLLKYRYQYAKNKKKIHKS